MCAAIGTLIAKMHRLTENHNLERMTYNVETLLQKPLGLASSQFSESLEEMGYLKTLSQEISNVFSDLDSNSWKQGNVHLDIWYDNLSVTKNGKITLFDFDFCGNGWFVLDVAYFCSQLFHIETDKGHYVEKRDAFLDAYQKIRPLSKNEILGIPHAGAAVWLFYLGVQSQRFDWSNIFLTENYLKMYVGRIKSWLDFAK